MICDILSGMNWSSFCFYFLMLLYSIGMASAPAADEHRHRIVLAGDSTVTIDAGWGTGFASLLNSGTQCVNLARGGRSSRSYRAEGSWQKCLDAKPEYLLIQFGHNDQPGKGPQRESAADGDFRDHLRDFVKEARAIGAQPVLITPLTRRRWTDDDRIQPTLSEYAQAASVVAKETNVPLLDLHRLSIDQCNAIGSEAFRAFEPMTENGADHTHLNPNGRVAVGRIVAKELVRLLPEFQSCLNPQAMKWPNPQSPFLQHQGSDLRLTESESTITISNGDRTILAYNKNSPPVPDGIDDVYFRSGFLHPVVSPAGKVLTAAFPYDHPHQQGVFSAWVKTQWNDRDIDFWNLAGRTGRVVHQRLVSTFSNDSCLGFEVDLVHRATQEPVVDLLRERWKIEVQPTDGTFYCFDLETTQSALTHLPLIVQKYHYGGLALRGPTRWLQGKVDEAAPGEPEIREPNSFTNDLGSDRKQGNHQKARWVSLTGTIDNQPSSITVLCHANNFRAPQSARLHPTKPYFCFAPCVGGEFVIDKDHPFHSQYRYFVTNEVPDSKWLNEKWQLWCGSASR